MKRILYLIILAVIIMTACQPKTQKIGVNTMAVKEEVTAFLDKYHVAFHAKDVDAMKTMMDNDGLYCGTDSKEFLNKEGMLEMTKQAFADTSFIPVYKIDKREIRISENGNSAIAVEQFIFSSFSQKIPFRLVSHLMKRENGWMFNFQSFSFIPNNEDIPKLNKALE